MSQCRSLGELFFEQAARLGTRPFLHHKQADPKLAERPTQAGRPAGGGASAPGPNAANPAKAATGRDGLEAGWHSWSWDRCAAAVCAVARALVGCGLAPGARVAILSENRPEWLLADLACLSAGLVDVPIYPTNPANEVEQLLQRSAAQALFLSSYEQWEKVAPLLARLPALRHVFVFDEITAVAPAPSAVVPATFASLLARDESFSSWTIPPEVKVRLAAVDRSALATILYTSGTTGAPKGVMLTHGNFLSNVEGLLQHIPVGPGDKTLSFLPLSHSFERTGGHYALLMAGGEIAYATATEKVPLEIKEVRPTIVLGVPRFYEKVQARILGAVERAPRYRRALFRFALQVADQMAAMTPSQTGESKAQAIPLKLRFRQELAERLVFSLLRRRLGGRLRFFVSGGAPLDAEVVRFFGRVGLPVLEGYGLTETSPVVTCNRPGRVKPGSVGETLTGVSVRIAEDGEILVQGPNVMRGYLDQPDATAEVLDADGTFHTGDIGHLDRDGYLFVTDRKKDLIIGSNGKNVAPAQVEGLMKRERAIADVCLIGDRRPYMVALLVADETALRNFMQEHGERWTHRADMLVHPAVRHLFQDAVLRVNEQLAPPERVRRFALLLEAFSQENGELTPTLKVRRRVVEQHYHAVIEQLYAPSPEPVNGIPIVLT